MSREVKRQIRSYKKAFDNGTGEDPEFPEAPARKDLTEKQKGWVVRAWSWASVALLGFEEPQVPNAIPCYNERKGFFHRPAIAPQIHHLQPIGEATRLDGTNNYNRPNNLAPVSSVNHVGTGATEDDLVIHPDTKEAHDNWGLFQQGAIPNPYHTMGQERKKATNAGLIYHDDSYDEYLKDLAEQVNTQYSATHPEDKFPFDL